MKGLDVLKQFEGAYNFPQIIDTFQFGTQDVIVESLFGPSLSKLGLFYGGPFTLSTVCLIAIKLLNHLQNLHNLGYLHNDLILSNLCWGRFKQGKIIQTKEIFLIDFDLWTKFRFYNLKQIEDQYKKYNKAIHYENIEASKLHGNLKFMAKDVLNSKRPSRKTELESLIYLIIFFIKQELPWSNIKYKNIIDRINKIISIHNNLDIKKLFHNLPYQLSFIFKDIKELGFESKPKYDLYTKLFKEILHVNNIDKLEFCWIKKIYDNHKNYENESD